MSTLRDEAERRWPSDHPFYQAQATRRYAFVEGAQYAGRFVRELAAEYIKQAQRLEERGWNDGKVRDLRGHADDLYGLARRWELSEGEAL